jgi:hypothetical protein
MMPDALRPIRLRFDETAVSVSGRDCAGPVTYPVLVGRVFGDPVVPSQGGRYFSVRPVDFIGAEVEAGTALALPDSTRSLLVFVTGTPAPSVGDDLICRFVGNRWVAEMISTGQDDDHVTVADCPCATTPRVLRMSSSHPSSNDGMFQNATLTHQSIPSSLNELSLPSHGHLSDSLFGDPRTGDYFWYYFSCDHGSYTISRLFAVSVNGSPYRDVVRYRWLNGQAGNSCQPFLLTNGLMFAGGDSTCVVTITQ